MTCQANLFNSRGRKVRTISNTSSVAHEGVLSWNGLDDSRSTLPIGIYIVYMEIISTENGATYSAKAVAVLARNLN